MRKSLLIALALCAAAMWAQVSITSVRYTPTATADGTGRVGVEVELYNDADTAAYVLVSMRLLDPSGARILAESPRHRRVEPGTSHVRATLEAEGVTLSDASGCCPYPMETVVLSAEGPVPYREVESRRDMTTFHTPKGWTRIAVLSDVHVTPGNLCDSMLRVAVDEINGDADIDLVVLNGDLSNEGSDAELRNVKSIMDGLTKHLEVLPGNHECTWSQSAVKTFSDLWGRDRFVYEPTDELVLIGINCGPFMKMGDGHIKQEDLHWLRQELEQRLTPGKRVLSFNHYPLQDDLDNWVDYVNLLEEYPVIGHINGHYHFVKPYRAGSIDAMMTRALQMRNGSFGYTLVDVTPDSVLVYDKTLGHEPVRLWGWKAEPHHTVSRLDEPLDENYPGGIRKVWTDSASVFTIPAAIGPYAVFGTSTGHARCIDITTGELVWDHPTGASLYGAPTPLIPSFGNVVMVPAADGLHAIALADGTTIGVKPSIEGPYVADGLRTAANNYYQGGYKRMECYDGETSALKWRYDSIFNYCQARPSLSPDGARLVFGAWDSNLRCLDAETGRLEWVWNNGKAQNMLGPGNVVPVVGDSIVIIVAPDRYMTAIDLESGRTLWRDNSVRYRESLGASPDGRTAYAKTMDGALVAVAVEPQFRQLWSVDLGLGYDHAPCPIVEVDGVIFVGSRRGIVTAVDAESHEVMWQARLGRSEVNGFTPTWIVPEGDRYPRPYVVVTLTEGTVFSIPVAHP